MTKTPTPPPAPPAPPSATELTPTIPEVAAESLKDKLAQISADITSIARKIPTPNVTDSDLHGKQLQEIATKLKAFSKEL